MLTCSRILGVRGVGVHMVTLLDFSDKSDEILLLGQGRGVGKVT